RSIAGRFHFLARDAERRIIRDAAFAGRPLEHDAQGVEEIALCERCPSLAVDNALHVLARRQHGAPAATVGSIERFMAVLPAEIFKDVAAGALCLWRACLE